MGIFLKVYNKKILWAPLVCWASDTQPCAQRQDLCPMGTLMISGGRHIFPKYWKWFWCKFWEKKWGSVKGTRNCPKDFVLILAIQNVVAGENLTNGHKLELGEEESGDQPWEPMSKECSGWREQCKALRWECSRLFKKLRPAWPEHSEQRKGSGSYNSNHITVASGPGAGAGRAPDFYTQGDGN